MHLPLNSEGTTQRLGRRRTPGISGCLMVSGYWKGLLNVTRRRGQGGQQLGMLMVYNEGDTPNLIKHLDSGFSSIISSMPCSASRFVSMYLAEMRGRKMSSADTNTNGRGPRLCTLGDIDKKVSHTLKAGNQSCISS